MSDLGNKKIMGDNILYYLSVRDVSRKDFAKAIGVPYSSVTEWINGRAYPRIDRIEKMAKYFGIEKADLVEKRNPGLDYDVRRLIELVKNLSPAQRKTVLAIINAYVDDVKAQEESL